MKLEQKPRQQLGGPIVPKEVVVFYEEGVPYLRYTGTTSINGHRAEIRIPKLSLQFDQMNATSYEEDIYDSVCGKKVGTSSYAQRLYIQDSRYLEFEILPQEVTLDELEKMLEHPVVIKEKK